MAGSDTPVPETTPEIVLRPLTMSQARESRRRVEQVEAQIEQLLKARRAGNGSHAVIPEPSAGAPGALVSAPIVMPVGESGPGWWRQLTTGTGDREVERGTAIKIVRQILSDVFGQLRSQNSTVEFAPGSPILLRDVHQAIQAICGADGWTALRTHGEAQEMGKLIITPEILALQAERKALEMRKEQQPEPLPPLVKAFWEHQEADIPPWRMESSEERERREELESAGVRWL